MGVEMATVRTTVSFVNVIFVVLLNLVKGTDSPIIPCGCF